MLLLTTSRTGLCRKPPVSALGGWSRHRGSKFH